LVGGYSTSGGSSDIITLNDSNPLKTFSTTGLAASGSTFMRPSADAGDATLCLDNSINNVQNDWCARTPNRFSFYLNKLPNTNSSNWDEQLATTGHTFKVNVSIPSNTLTSGANGTAIHQIAVFSTTSIAPIAVGAGSCSDQTFTLTNAVTSDRVSSVTPPAALGNISLNGYVSAANTLLLHFCNPTAIAVTPPAGVYSILAVH
jgi:hypothetical protein